MGKSSNSKKVPPSSSSSAVGGRGGGKSRDNRATSGGCMSSVFHFFDLHHPPPSSFGLPLPLTGTEAPRNSLELESKVSTLSSSEQDDKLHIPMGMQIKTSCDERRSTSVDLSSSSPGIKTPTLVARLMGLDILPDSPSSTPTTKSHRPGTRSLPDTPRLSSSSSRRSMDADHRLSLQINVAEALERSSKRRNEIKWQDENRIPSEYARQIMKQVKETVSKRVGLADVTNTSVPQRRDQELIIKHLNSKTSSRSCPKPDDQLIPANNSPRLRFFDSKTKPKQGKKVIKKPPQTSDIMRKNKQQEPFVRSASTAIKRPTANIITDHNKTPLLPSRILSPAKKDHSSQLTKILLLQTQVPGNARESRGRSQLSSCLSHDEYNQRHTARDKHNGGGATTGEYQYVTRILNRTGIHKDKSLSLTTCNWFSPSHPLHPSLFLQLERSPHPPPTTTAAHRRLVFHLVDEMLAQILRPHLNPTPWCTSTVAQHFGHMRMRGSQLADTLCAKIRSFPAKDCSVLEDIDDIIEGDLVEWKIRDVGRLALEEEGERIVTEIEEELVDTFLHETAAMVASWGRFGREGCWRRNGGVWG